MYGKTLAMIESEPELDLATFGTVTAPTLVLQGDRDAVTLEHGDAVAAALPDARLAVLPGTHALPLELPGVVNPLLISFLRGSAGHAGLGPGVPEQRVAAGQRPALTMGGSWYVPARMADRGWYRRMMGGTALLGRAAS